MAQPEIGSKWTVRIEGLVTVKQTTELVVLTEPCTVVGIEPGQVLVEFRDQRDQWGNTMRRWLSEAYFDFSIKVLSGWRV